MGISWEMPRRFPPVIAAIHHPGEETVSLPPSEDGPNTKGTATKASPEELFLWTTSPKTATVVSRNVTEWNGAQTTSSS